MFMLQSFALITWSLQFPVYYHPYPGLWCFGDHRKPCTRGTVSIILSRNRGIEVLLINESSPCCLSSHGGTGTMHPKVKLGPGVHKGYRQVTSRHKWDRVDTWCWVQWIADFKSPLLGALSEELVVFPINLRWEDTKEGGQETHLNYLLQGCEAQGCVSNHTLVELPFILKSKCKSGLSGWGIELGNNTKHPHHTHPFPNSPSHSSFRWALPMKPSSYSCPIE